MSSNTNQLNSMSQYCHRTIVILILLSCWATTISGFNLSPQPNVILREPQMKTAMPKMRSSYFGFSLNLKRDSVIIGAPRAQSTLESQRKINESGAIYKCLLSDSTCTPFVFDPWGNLNDDSNPYTYDRERKHTQWLGASMDGGDSNDEKMVVCAPRIYTETERHYLMQGACYWSQNTSSSKPLHVQKIAPLRFRDKQQLLINNDRYFYYMYGEQGISVHITENNEEILIGAPGIFTWKGSVVRYKAKPLVDLGGLSRRDEDGVTMPRQHEYEPPTVEYSSDVPNPMLWDQDDNSYFGFAVSSGFFDGPTKGKLLYMASAPQANLQQGEAYIFDIVNHYAGTEKTIKIYYTFSGEQFGEYFGYALITEDFDNDGFVDVAIAAPYHAKGGTHENGAVYIFRNGGSASDFTLATVLRTDYEFSGRFGTTISKIGDIDKDGYNDIAVAAPFEGNGAVYIFHGGPNGLSSKPSQRLSAPDTTILSDPINIQHMFGHGLSKGADIDGNHYLDLAVGAPNAESVFVYRAYPIVRINATISPQNQEIKTTDRSFKLNACWSMETMHSLDFGVDVQLTIKLDGQLNRATFETKKNTYEFSRRLTTNEQCIELTAFVTFSIADIFKPIELEMAYNVIKDMPRDSQEFCNNCVAVNPSDPKSVKNKVVFSTGCKAAKCVADLSVKSSLVDVVKLPFILGSLSSLLVDYQIKNTGETAYLAQIRIILPEAIGFTKTPSSCVLSDKPDEANVMTCDVNGGSPMFRGDSTSIRISVDATKLDGNELLVKAHVFSTGDELNGDDNTVEDVIPLGEFSDIEISGDASKEAISLANGLRVEYITHTFEIRNNGPSNIKSLDVLISVPMSFINPWTVEREKLIDFTGISLKSVYNNQPLTVEWTQDNVILISDAVETTTTTQQSLLAEDSYNGMQFDPSNLGPEFDLNSNTNGDPVRRRRRSTFGEPSTRRWSPYMQRILENGDQETDDTPFSFDSLRLNRLERDVGGNKNAAINNLPLNRTMFFDCQKPFEEHCFQARITALNFKAGNTPIMISLNFTIDLNKIDKILTEKRDIFVIQTAARVHKTGSEDTSDLQVVKALPFTIISKFIETSTPIWVYIVSIIFGILTLILITYILHKLGFFRRGKREELVKLKRQSEALSYYPKEDEE